METEKFMENMLTVLPYWHYIIDKNFKQSLKDKMSLESYYCLQTLRANGSITMTELAHRLKISKQQATQIVERLYRYEFVCRTNDEQDRRCIKIEITQKAENYIQEAYYQDTAFLERLEGRIGKEDMEEFSNAVESLLRILPKLED